MNVKLRFFATVSTDQRPTADSQSVSAEAGTAMTLTLTGGDPDGDTLTFAIPNPRDHGTVGEISTPSCSGTPSTCTAEVTYTPDSGYSGTDYVIFKTNDGLFDSRTAGTVSVTVTGLPSNQAPWADNSSPFWMSSDTSIVITLTGGDPDGDDLSFEIDVGPTVGTIGSIGNVDCSGTIPSTCSAEVTYYPQPDYYGSDPFTYFTFDDGGLSSDVATVNVHHS